MVRLRKLLALVVMVTLVLTWPHVLAEISWWTHTQVSGVAKVAGFVVHTLTAAGGILLIGFSALTAFDHEC